MKRNYKVVYINNNSNEEELFDFYETIEEAEAAKPILAENYPRWITDVNRLIVKPVNLEQIQNPVATDYSHYCRSLIPDHEWMRVIKSDASAEIHAGCLICGYGGRDYYYLSKMINKDWTVINVGCAYNAQAYFFLNHAKFIAVDLEFPDDDIHIEYFHPEGTDFYKMSGQEFIHDILPTLDLNLKKTFAICHWVPSDECQKMVRETFPNCFVIYP